MTLDQLAPGGFATVSEVDTSQAVSLRLMEMGLVPGARVSVRKRSPFGGPLELKVGGYILTLRRNEARSFRVQR